MTQTSPPELRILHAVRLLGFADTTAIAARAGTDPVRTHQVLVEAEALGWTQELAFADLHGWSLTDEGRTENERQLAQERLRADRTATIEAVYREFLPLNARLLRACTDWQLIPTPGDRFAANDHADPDWDGRVLSELSALGDALAPLTGRLTGVLERFAGYDTRFAAALRRAMTGEREWVDATGVDSCHRVWFQLHEDLIATLGLDRATEHPAP